MKMGIIGFGWLGIPLAKELISIGIDVIGTTTRDTKLSFLKSEGIIAHSFQIEEDEGLPASFFDGLSYLVVNIPLGRNLNREKALIGFEKLINNLPKNCIPVFCSSISVYQNVNRVVDESEQLLDENNLNRVIEKLFQEKRPDSIILRLGGLIGFGRNPIRQLSGRKELLGANDPVNLVHGKDIISFVLLLIQSGTSSELFNLCSPEHPSKKEYYSRMAEILELDKPEFITSEVNYKLIDSQKSLSLANFQYQSSIYQF